MITFESPLLLPKGKTYHLVVPEGVIYREGKPDITNEKLEVEFSVPSTLGQATPTVEEGSVVERKDRIGFFSDSKLHPSMARRRYSFVKGFLLENITAM